MTWWCLLCSRRDEDIQREAERTEQEKLALDSGYIESKIKHHLRSVKIKIQDSTPDSYTHHLKTEQKMLFLGMKWFLLFFCWLRSSSLNSVLQPLNCGSRFMSFFNSPQVKFYWNIASYFGFLWLFAVVLMIDFQTFPSWRELLLYIWLGSLVCEEVRQVRHTPHISSRDSVWIKI